MKTMSFKKKLVNGNNEPTSSEISSSQSTMHESSLLQNPSLRSQQWTNSREFLLSCIAMSVGLGNVWRFPYVAYENGGGAFLIPYFIMLFLVGRPIYFMELIMGQFSSMTATKVWKEMTPLFRGIGFGQLIACIYVLSYYSTLIAIAIYYFFASFSKTLPWTKCDPDIHSVIDGIKEICKEELDETNSTVNQLPQNLKLTLSREHYRYISPAEQYFVHDVLKMKSDISDGLGAPDIKLLGCLALSYLLLFLSMCKGVKSSGKVLIVSSIKSMTVILVNILPHFVASKS